MNDLLSLGDFNEGALLHNIRVRYYKDQIYTGIGGPILLSVNPYGSIPGLYSEQMDARCKQAVAAAQNGAAEEVRAEGCGTRAAGAKNVAFMRTKSENRPRIRSRKSKQKRQSSHIVFKVVYTMQCIKRLSFHQYTCSAFSEHGGSDWFLKFHPVPSPRRAYPRCTRTSSPWRTTRTTRC